MHAHAQTAARSTLRGGLPLLGAIAAALLAAPAASANSYHVDLDSSALIAAATPISPGGGSAPDTYARINGHGVEVHPASGAYVPVGAWGVTAVYPPSGTAFLNSAITWSSCAPSASGQFVSFLTAATGPSWLAQSKETAAGCTEHTWPSAMGADPGLRDGFALGLRAEQAVFGASAAWHADLTRIVADIQDNTAPTLGAVPADVYTNDRAFSLPVRVVDSAAGPAQVLAQVDSQGLLLRAPTYDSRRLVAPSNGGETVLDTTYPVLLPDADGTHAYFVTAYDAAGNWSTSQSSPAHVILDRVAPAVVNAPNASDFNVAGWCHAPCRVTTRATDEWLQTTSVNVNGSAVTPDADTIDLAKLGAEGAGVSVAVAATDKATNANGLTRSYKVDITAPTVIVNAAATWQRTPVDVVVTTSDALSGIASSSCTVDHAPAVPATTFRLEEGVHAVTCTAADAAGNVTTTTKTVSIDGSAPTVAVDAGDAWVDRDQVVTVTATDPALADGHAGSGVTSFAATVDGHVAPIVDGTVRVQGEGQHTLVLTAADAAGNAASLTRTIKVDATAPAAALSAAPRYTASPDVTLHWSASDVLSGLGAVRLVLDGQPGADLAADGSHAGEVAAHLPAEGSHTISLQATDIAGNTVTVPAQTVVFDATAPVIAAPKVNGANAAGWCTGTCGVVISAADGGAGLASIAATVNGQPVAVDAVDAGALSIARTIDVTGAGTSAVTVVATLTDNAGNSRSVTAVARVDADAPTLALVGADPATRGLRVAVADAASGVREVTAAFGASLIALSPTGERDSHGAVVYAATVPTAGWPSDLHGVALLVSASDVAGNVSASLPAPFPAVNGSNGTNGGTGASGGGTTPPPPSTGGAGGAGGTGGAGSPGSTSTTGGSDAARAQATLTLTLRDKNGRLTAKPRTEKAGAKLTLSGLLAAGKPLQRAALKVSLENGKFTALSRHYSVTTDAKGAFKLTVPASMTGLIVVRYGGSATTTAVVAKAGTIVVQPKIVARFVGIVRGGHIRSIHVTGRFLPVPGGSFTLRWQARVPHGRWQWIGATNEQTVVRPNGTFKGSWTPGAAIDPRVQYRLVLTPNVAPYPRTASAAATVRIP